ncbi:MAG TPA: 2-C-methyl-D-erythritol 2,4-cyclodiphosphate synthase [Bacilli bacterium]|nr:2-C-methyl-D-erythritol 2,4-cyclodiphosphate synthase [Bacilli bacterium]
MKIGFASDIHQLVSNRKLILAGVVIPAPFGELAHSDGDVIYHAVAEAILGALALGDLGDHFPDADAKNKDMDSSLIVSHAVKLMNGLNYRVGNVDVSIHLEEPKLKSYKLSMRENLARLLNVDISCVSIKVGTNEKMDAVGQKKAIQADAIVLLEGK